VEITQKDIADHKENCRLFFNACVMFYKGGPTAWTIGYAIPYYTEQMYKELGYGLGLNTTQGREAKHTKKAKQSEKVSVSR
jgi:hypothetical protein